jgi:cyanophycinase
VRALVPTPPLVDPDETGELASANRDLRKMARDIAAGDIGPSELRRRIVRRSRGVR